MKQALQVYDRAVTSKGDLRKLRNEGKVPAVVYGKHITVSSPIAVDAKELLALVRYNPNAVLEVEVPSAGKQPVMLSAVQRDSISREILHADFRQINLNEAVRTTVRLDITGDPEGVREGGILQVQVHELEIECLPNAIPETIACDVSGLQIGENLIASDLQLPSGVELKADPELVVVTILVPQKEVEEAEEGEAAQAEAEAETAGEPAEDAKDEAEDEVKA